jgi:hypothetical protein
LRQSRLVSSSTYGLCQIVHRAQTGRLFKQLVGE